MRLVLLVLCAAIFAMGQATASQPASPCPDIDAIVKTIPAELWPAKSPQGADLVAHQAKVKEWSDKNAKGKEVDFSALRTKLVSTSSGNRTSYEYAGKPKTKIFIVVNGDAGKGKCNQMQVYLNGLGDYSITFMIDQ